MKILNFGSMNLDYVYQVPRFVQPGETLAALSQELNPGGKGLNQSIALARAGAHVCHAGCVGRGGEELVRLLAANGVDTSLIEAADCLQGNAVIQVNAAGENCILLFGGSNRAVTRAQIDRALDGFGPGDFLVAQNEMNELGYLLASAAEKGMQVVLNPSPFEEALHELDYDRIAWLLVNEVEARQLTGLTEPQDVWNALHSRFPGLNVVLTLGGEGAFCFTPSKTVAQPAFPAQVADTTAAGDTFTGFFLAALTQGRSLEECMRRAAMASSIGVSRPGASCSIPTADEVDASLQRA